MTLYATLADARAVIRAESTVDDNKVLANLRVVSRRIDRFFQSRVPYFAPVIETRRYALVSSMVNSALGTLALPDPTLVALTSLSIGGTALTEGTHFEVWQDGAQTPITTLRLKDTYASWYSFCASDGAPLRLTVNGVWAMHRDYANAWMVVDALAANINDSVTTLAVADVDGGDAYGLTPRISAGNLLKIGDEFLEVTATNTGTNVVTVRRGVNGSTAAAHSAADTVSTWQVEENIRRATARQAGLMYSRAGAYTTVEVQGMSEVRYPVDLLVELRAAIQEFAYGS